MKILHRTAGVTPVDKTRILNECSATIRLLSSLEILRAERLPLKSRTCSGTCQFIFCYQACTSPFSGLFRPKS
ncbi:hypothetical protein A0H81_00946 [Grifola frondosa]|uniref:Uncharacterized protein n=1 Tax=Grifola frondosa TaxID=5627 RepID=A0A1C7MRA8_GRIFR|nr:hypothetical protein A0H81_00946 [Grifola frondosa]